MKIVRTLQRKAHLIITVEEERSIIIKLLQFICIGLNSVFGVVTDVFRVFAVELDKKPTYEVFISRNNIKSGFTNFFYLKNGNLVGHNLTSKIARLVDVFDDRG